MSSHHLRRRSRPAAALLGLALLATACDGDRPFALEPESPAASLPTAGRPSRSTGLISDVVYTALPALSGVTTPAGAGAGINAAGWVAGSTTGHYGGLWVENTRATLWTPAGAQDLGVLGAPHSSKHSWATDVNDAGTVVGYATGAAAGGGCCAALSAFAWTQAGGMVALPRLAEGKATTAAAINGAGHIAGAATDAAGTQHAVVWRDPAQPPLDLGTFGGSFAAATDINEAGQVVGSVAGGAGTGAFLWSEGAGVQYLGHLGGGYAEARAVSEAGHVVGYSLMSDDTQHPFRWTPAGGMQDLGLPPGAAHAQAYGINEAGHIAVTATLPEDGANIIATRAYLWVEGDWIDLGGTLGWTGAAALNDAGQVAGYGLSPATAFNEAARWQVTLSRRALGTFAGFFAPIDNPPALNRVRAGSAIPVKFSLGGDYGLDIFAPGSPSSQPVACEAGAPVAPVEETVTAGGSSLSYDSATGQYVYVWKTQKAWGGTCRRLTVRLADGTERWADFRVDK